MAGALSRFAETLGHRFARPELLTQALTHPSLHQGRKGQTAPYERLEFLGDRVLGLVVADMLFHAFPREAEGELARRYTALVRRETVARVALAIGLDERLAMAKGDEEAGGRANQSMLADACEAVIGALYADGGFEAASGFIRNHWSVLMKEEITPPKDAKTALQEWAQARARPLPTYQVVGSDGPPHEPVFLVEVSVDGAGSAQGRGSSKRVAEQAAAAALLEQVRQ